MKQQKKLLYISAIIMFILQACNLPGAAPADETPTLEPLVAAQLTITAAALQFPTVEPTLTFTPLPTISPTPASTATPAFTSTPAFAYVTLSEATNCRVGPGTEYGLVDTFLVGQAIEVVGKHPFDNFWYVRSPKNASVYCWLWGFYATGANLNNVPVLTPPPSPTPAATGSFTAEYVNAGTCVASSWWTRINLTNKGAVPFKSISISLKDTVTSETRSSSVDGFQDVNACALTSITSALGPDEAYTVVAPTLSADPSGHKVTATIQLCSEKALGGTCVSESIEFTP